MELQTSAPSNKPKGPRRPTKADAISIANKAAPFILGGGLGVLRVDPPRWWRRLSLYARALVLSAVGEIAMRRGLRETAGACFALGAEFAAELVARKIAASKLAKATAVQDQSTAQGLGVGQLPVGYSAADEALRQYAAQQQAFGALPLGYGQAGTPSRGIVGDALAAA